MYSSAMAVLDHPHRLSVTEATQRGVAGMINDAETHDIVVTRRNHPVAVIVSMDRMEHIQNLIDDLRDLTLAASRVITDDGVRISFDDLLAAYGLSREDLADPTDDLDDKPTSAERSEDVR